jgi:hypothetical protein
VKKVGTGGKEPEKSGFFSGLAQRETKRRFAARRGRTKLETRRQKLEIGKRRESRSLAVLGMTKRGRLIRQSLLFRAIFPTLV